MAFADRDRPVRLVFDVDQRSVSSPGGGWSQPERNPSGCLCRLGDLVLGV